MSKAKKATTEKNSLLQAVEFVAAAQRSAGTKYQTHCKFSDGWVYAYDDLLSIGQPVEQDLNSCPHTSQLISALKKCGNEYKIVQPDVSKIQINSGKFKAVIGCVDEKLIPSTAPDPKVAIITDAIKPGLLLLAKVIEDSSARVHEACVCLTAQTMTATDGKVIIQNWHGIDLPPNILIPKKSAVLIGSCDKALSGFGFSRTSATFYFEDGSFIKTQLMNGNYPNVDRFFSQAPSNCVSVKIPENFYEGLSNIADFVKTDGKIYFLEGMLSTDMDTSQASTFVIDNMPSEMVNRIFALSYLELIKPIFKTGQFFETQGNPMVLFSHESFRGVLAGVFRNVR